MKKSLSVFVLMAVAAIGATAITPAGAAPVAPKGTTTPHRVKERRHNVHHDVSAPLSEIPPAAVQPPRPEGADTGLPIATPTGAPDPVVQSSQPGLTIPSTSTNFNGVGNGFAGPQGTFTVNSAPPDTNGAVGPNHYVQIVNSDFAIFNKSGTALYGPVPINTLWSGFGGGCQTNNDGDPIVNYDRISDRWVISQFSVSTTPFLECVAVSQTSDPLGAYYRYSFAYANFNDYPKLAVWPDAYYVTFNDFNAAGTAYLGSEACAYDRTKMLTGQAATQQCFMTPSTIGGLLPSDLDGSRLPPAGSPNYLVALGASANQLASWKFHVDWATPANTTFTGPATMATAAFSELCNGGTCVPQSGTTQKLDSLADRLMFRLAYRNFGDHEAMVVTHSVTAGTSGGIRWYELRPNAGTLSIFQQGTYAPDANYRWMGSAAMDASGDIGVGFSISGSTIHPGIHYTGRLPGDALGALTQGEGTIINGAGSQTGSSLSRWGDYSDMTVDPTDDCTFWYTNEYIPANGSFNWSTRIGSFKFPSCTAVAVNDFSINATPNALTVAPGSSTTSTISTAVTSGAAQNVALSVSGLPSGVSASFSPSTVSAGGSSTLTITAAANALPGPATLAVTGTGTSATQQTAVSLTVSTPSVDPVASGGFETGTLASWNSAGTTSVGGGAHSGSFAAQLGSPSPTNGDSTVAQTFAVPAVGGKLAFWYQITCPDVVGNDWATVALHDNTANTNKTVLAKKCTNTGKWVKVSTPVLGSHSYTLTLTNHDNNTAGTATFTHYDDVAVVYNPVANPGFESGTLGGWTASGTVSVGGGAHTGSFAAQAGAGSATNGDSSVAQTFTIPSGSTTLSFFYKMTCPDVVAHDWVTATLHDNTANTTKTILAKKCATNAGYLKLATAAKTFIGHSVTLTLTNHDDNGAGDPSFTLFDDVNLV